MCSVQLQVEGTAGVVDTESEGVADLVEGITAAGVLARVLDVDASPVQADCRIYFINDEPVIHKAAKIYNIQCVCVGARTCGYDRVSVCSDDLQIERSIMLTRS